MDYRKRSSLPTNTLSREARFHESWICCSLAHTHQFVMATSISMLLPRLRLFSASRTWHDELALNINRRTSMMRTSKKRVFLAGSRQRWTAAAASLHPRNSSTKRLQELRLAGGGRPVPRRPNTATAWLSTAALCPELWTPVWQGLGQFEGDGALER